MLAVERSLSLGWVLVIAAGVWVGAALHRCWGRRRETGPRTSLPAPPPSVRIVRTPYDWRQER